MSISQRITDLAQNSALQYAGQAVFSIQGIDFGLRKVYYCNTNKLKGHDTHKTDSVA